MKDDEGLYCSVQDLPGSFLYGKALLSMTANVPDVGRTADR